VPNEAIEVEGPIADAGEFDADLGDRLAVGVRERRVTVASTPGLRAVAGPATWVRSSCPL
jgi:hypothetical protein